MSSWTYSRQRCVVWTWEYLRALGLAELSLRPKIRRLIETWDPDYCNWFPPPSAAGIPRWPVHTGLCRIYNETLRPLISFYTLSPIWVWTAGFMILYEYIVAFTCHIQEGFKATLSRRTTLSIRIYSDDAMFGPMKAYHRFLHIISDPNALGSWHIPLPLYYWLQSVQHIGVFPGYYSMAETCVLKARPKHIDWEALTTGVV